MLDISLEQLTEDPDLSRHNFPFPLCYVDAKWLKDC